MDLCLDTVGIAMRHSAPASAALAEILNCARKNGVTALDTSGAYGEAEKAVGTHLDGDLKDAFEITVKIRPGALFNIAPNNYYATLKSHVQGSLSNLKIKTASACMFHNAEYIDDNAAIEALHRLKHEKLAKKIGMVINLPQEFSKAMDIDEIDIISIPYNLLDTRLDGLLKKTDKEVYARGAFLNGLLLKDADDTPQELAGIKPYLMRIDQFCEYHGIDRINVMLGFIRTQPKISRLTFGVDNLDQLMQVTQNADCSYNQTALRELIEEFSGVADALIMPSLWHGEYK